MGMTSSSTPLHNRVIVENLGQAEGSDWSWSLLGLWSVGMPDMDKAINKAIASKNGDALINVRWYEKHYYFVLFSVTKVIVTGQVTKTAPFETKEVAYATVTIYCITLPYITYRLYNHPPCSWL